MNSEVINWHALEEAELLSRVEANPEGLNDNTASARLAIYGENTLTEKKNKPAWVLFLHQFNDFMILVLIVAAIISGIVGDITDTLVILGIVVLNAVMGFIQENRAERAISALKKMAAPLATALRNGQAVSIPASRLVPGDIILLEAGNLVPADLRLIETYSFRIDESSLTGESIPTEKTNDTLENAGVLLADRTNMAYKGTMVVAGRAKGIVVATGMKTEIGKIAGLLQEKESVTPLQQRMNDFGKKLSYLILFICAALFIIGILRGEEAVKMMMVAISLAVAAIPEALPALITIALARGAKRLAKKNALVRKLPAVETLGSVTFICSDKTGTITENKMKVMEVMAEPVNEKLDEAFSTLECCMAVNHTARKTTDGGWLGDPMEIALIQYLEERYGFMQLAAVQNKLLLEAELPFDSDRKCMTTIHKFGNGFIAISKGAAESIAGVLQNKNDKKIVLDKASHLAKLGMRTLAYSYRMLYTIPQPFSYEEIENEMVFAGLVGLSDPARKEIKAAVRECRSAGIQVVMITGDHLQTAAAIAREIGILAENESMITGKELSELSPEQLNQSIEKIKVYARVSPQQKLDVIRTLQRKNHFVAMTGDGVNDAPSLKAANIGLAMGITGTDVSREAAHMVLLDDNFATIVKAIKEGRRIYDNIRKFVKYIMTCNGAEIWTMFLAPLLGLPVPLLPIQILWINLVTDGLPGLALTMEKAERDIMKRPPRKTDESLFAGGTGYHVVWVGLLMAFITLSLQAWAIHQQNPHWQTMVFTVLSLSQLSHVFAIRSDREFIYRKGILSNKPLSIIIAFTLLLQLIVIYLPATNDIFKTQPLSIAELFICVIASLIIFHVVELEKWARKKFHRNTRQE